MRIKPPCNFCSGKIYQLYYRETNPDKFTCARGLMICKTCGNVQEVKKEKKK